MLIREQTEDAVIVDTPAKVNLFLEVLGRRPDGYHNINSLFQAVSLFDRLTCQVSASGGIRLSVAGADDLSSGSDNLVWRAYELLRKTFSLKRGLRIKLEKRIPVAAGLAGGSSDAAATILACNVLFELGLTYVEMARLGLQLGSDVPFFFFSGQALVRGRGELVEPTAYPTDYWLVLATPRLSISTSEAYASLKRGLTNPKNPFKLGRCEGAEAFVERLCLTRNDFEAGHLGAYPELIGIQGWLLGNGARLARMSGSGPTLFGLFVDDPQQEGHRLIAGGNWQSCTVQPIALPGSGHS